MRLVILSAIALAVVACGPKPASLEDINTRLVTLPNGRGIRSEVMTAAEDMMRGMMFRDSLEPGRGMLFVHQQPGNYPYWMFQVRIPLDMIWMDADRRIVEIAADTPPCRTAASQCPSYGGHSQAQYVLELAGGMAAKYGLKLGDRLEF